METIFVIVLFAVLLTGFIILMTMIVKHDWPYRNPQKARPQSRWQMHTDIRGNHYWKPADNNELNRSFTKK